MRIKSKITKKIMLIIPALLLFIFLHNPLVFGETVKKQDGGALRGVVKGLIVNNGQIYYTRIPGARVNLEFTKFKTVSGEDGRFEITNIPPGNYMLSINMENHDPITKQVEIKEGKMLRSGVFVFLIGMNKKLPSILPGSIIGAFMSVKEKKNTGNRNELGHEIKDTPLNSLIFYKPDTYIAYLEIVLADEPAMITNGNSGRYLYVANNRNNLEIWDLKNLEREKILHMPGPISDMEWNEKRTKLYLSFFHAEKSGIVIIDTKKRDVARIIIPPPTGQITSAVPVEDEDAIMGVIGRPKDGRLVEIRYNSKKSTITRNRKVGDLPIDLAYIGHFQNIIVLNHLGRNIITLGRDKMDIKFYQALDGTPARIIKGLKDMKAYVSVIDRGQVIVLDTETGRKIGHIPVGERPCYMCRREGLIMVGNRADRSISIIDGALDKVIAMTAREDFDYINGVTVLP
ncbi:MAG: carboxypeptidase-like regulatory domain-containing protein [Candidatus Eremiobacteraeota bacterium]|nr:carboxypeptidase-like regulatory domain-containing protein [Candidatus Eremiobacteraeota bacterium]